MTTLKNNNARLTAALEESTQHVAQWKTMLQKYKEENDQYKRKVSINSYSMRSIPLMIVHVRHVATNQYMYI